MRKNFWSLFFQSLGYRGLFGGGSRSLAWRRIGLRIQRDARSRLVYPKDDMVLRS